MKRLKMVTVVGARPQFVKAAAVSRAVRDRFSGQIHEVLVHTGQHYDDNMSKVFFDELDIPRPGYNLEIAGGRHGEMTGRMLEAVENVLLQERPDWLLIYGDTNSTLAGALAAAKLHVPVAHVEAGLRSFNMRMPEEVNRILSDRVSTLLFCPTGAAVDNLAAEGVRSGVHNVGDVMYDAALFYRESARTGSDVLQRLGLEAGCYALTTCHRAENTDDLARLRSILSALVDIGKTMPVVFPVHPRTRKLVQQMGLSPLLETLRVVEPQSFLDMLALEQAARVVLTDSGGVQKEAFFYAVPCVTMREETEWTETIECGANVLVGADSVAIAAQVERLNSGTWRPDFSIKPYGSGDAASRILERLLAHAV